MSLRHSLLLFGARYGLSGADQTRLFQLSARSGEPAHLERTVATGLALVAALFGGMGIVFWVAANWD